MGEEGTQVKSFIVMNTVDYVDSLIRKKYIEKIKETENEF